MEMWGSCPHQNFPFPSISLPLSTKFKFIYDLNLYYPGAYPSFFKGGSHCVKQRVLTSCCHLNIVGFLLLVTGTPRPPSYSIDILHHVCNTKGFKSCIVCFFVQNKKLIHAFVQLDNNAESYLVI